MSKNIISPIGTAAATIGTSPAPSPIAAPAPSAIGTTPTAPAATIGTAPAAIGTAPARKRKTLPQFSP